jgi:hypothetical protein
MKHFLIQQFPQAAGTINENVNNLTIDEFDITLNKPYRAVIISELTICGYACRSMFEV